MTTRTLAGAAVLASVLLLSACSTTTTATTADGDAPQGAASDATCDPAILAFLPEHGYPNPEPQSTLALPDGATTSLTPVCIVHDDFEGAPREAAFFAADEQDAFVADLEQAGYTESADFGASVLVSPSGHQLGLGTADVSGTTLLFVAF